MLALERIPNGGGDIYPDARLCLVGMDEDFRQAPLRAQEYLRSVGKWDKACDVRWSLRPWAADREEELLEATSFSGGSLGGAFGVGGWWLAEEGPPAYGEVYFVAVSAALKATGQFAPVTDKTFKLDKWRNLPLRQVTHVLLCPQDKKAVGPVEGIETVGIETVADAVGFIADQSRPRQAVREHEGELCKDLDILGWKQVPLERHYQVLPLLREVKRERLPRFEQGSRGAEEQLDLVRWEEELREERVTYEPVSLEEVFGDFRSAVKDKDEPVSSIPRFVVLGPPGSGKTTLEQYLAWVCSQPRSERSDRSGVGTERHSTPLVPARVRLREWEAWAVKPLDPPKASLPEYLAERYKDVQPAPTAEQWREWLQRGEVLLLLDGLDEIKGDSSFTDALKKALNLFKDCPTVLTCRTVSFEQHRTVCPDFPVFTLAGLEEAQRDAYIRLFPADHPDRYDPDALIAQLHRTPSMRPLAANPLLLSILCYVVDDPHGVTLPATRTELYNQAVEKLLTRPRRVEVSYPDGNKMLSTDRRRLLEHAALRLFEGAGQQRQLTFDEGRVLDALTEGARREGYGHSPRPYAIALLNDLTRNSGLLRGDPEQGYFFLHLTFQEYLTACALAHQAAAARAFDAWFETTLAPHLYDPAWSEVLTLLGGTLSPCPLVTAYLKVLVEANRQQQDLFFRPLLQAAWSLSEVPQDMALPLAKGLVKATTELHLRANWFDGEQVQRAVVALGSRAVPGLLQALRDAEQDVRGRAAGALGRIGSVLREPLPVTRAPKWVQEVWHKILTSERGG